MLGLLEHSISGGPRYASVCGRSVYHIEHARNIRTTTRLKIKSERPTRRMSDSADFSKHFARTDRNGYSDLPTSTPFITSYLRALSASAVNLSSPRPSHKQTHACSASGSTFTPNHVQYTAALVVNPRPNAPFVPALTTNPRPNGAFVPSFRTNVPSNGAFVPAFTTNPRPNGAFGREFTTNVPSNGASEPAHTTNSYPNAAPEPGFRKGLHILRGNV